MDGSCALSEKEAIAIFQKRLPKLSDQELIEVKNIVRRFKNLPVVIAQVANYYLSPSPIPLKEFLSRFDENKKVILSQGKLKNTTGRRKLTVGESQGLSYAQIEKLQDEWLDLYTSVFLNLNVIRYRSPEALGLLLHCAYLPNQNIPMKLLERLTVNSDALNDQLPKLQTLISFDQGTVSLHEAIQEVILDIGDPLSHNSEIDQRTILSNIGEMALDFKPFIDKNPLKAKMIYQRAIDDIKLPRLTAALNCIGESLGDAAQYVSSWVYANNPSSIVTLEVPNSTEFTKQKKLADLHLALGGVLEELFEWTGAVESKKEALNLYKDLHGEKHPDVAMSYGNVGNTLGALGRHEEALEYQIQALELRKEILGEKHSDVAASYNNVGNTLGELGKYEEALEYLTQALKLRKELFGEKHPDIAESENDLGITFGDLGKHEQALKLKKNALSLYKEIYGERHPLVALGYNNVGTTQGELGNQIEALELKIKALNLYIEIYGEKHYVVAMGYNNVGCTLIKFRRYQEASEYLYKSLNLYGIIFNEYHPEWITSCNNYGYTLSKLGRHKEALEYLRKALELRNKNLGEKHHLVAQSYGNIGSTLRELEKYKEALEYTLKSFRLVCECFEEYHPDQKNAFEKCLACLTEISDSKLKEKTKQELIAICTGKFGSDHELTLKAKSIAV